MFGTAPRVHASSVSLIISLLVTVTGLSAAPAAAATTLHNQFDNQAQTMTNSQNYDSVSDSYDNEAADDFEVPAGATWRIGTVEVAGQYVGTGVPTGVNVRIYADSSGLPGTLVKEWLNLQPTGGFGSPNFSNFSIPLTDPPQLTAGRYWISVQANLVSGSHWFWRNRTTTTLNPAAWRNPGGSWDPDCQNWGRRAATCAPGDELSTSDPDQVFRLLSYDPPVTSGVALDMDADDPAGTPTGNPGGCELTTAGGDANRESTATNRISASVQLDPGNFHRVCAAAFQTGQTANNGRISGAQITFTIQGPGRVFLAGADGSCSQSSQPPSSTTITVTSNASGIAYACLYSQQVGRTTVTASSGAPAQTATGTKDWTVDPKSARFIQLCHGDVAGTTCATGTQTNEPNDEHEMTTRVTDARGNPVANVPVQFRSQGEGAFTTGGSTATVSTDANGLAGVLITSSLEGTQTVVAEIQAGAGTNGARGPAANDDECEQPAGSGGQPAAGNCVSQPLTKVWKLGAADPQCDDGLDNDQDGWIDEGDPACTDPTDDSEAPVNAPPRDTHGRSISIRFNDGTGARNNGLVVFGRLRVTDGFTDCRSQQPVNVQRRVNGRWVTKKTTTTNRRGRYAVEIFDLASRYRAVAPRTEIRDQDLNRLDICQKAVKAKRHRH